MIPHQIPITQNLASLFSHPTFLGVPGFPRGQTNSQETKANTKNPHDIPYAHHGRRRILQACRIQPEASSQLLYEYCTQEATAGATAPEHLIGQGHD